MKTFTPRVEYPVIRSLPPAADAAGRTGTVYVDADLLQLLNERINVGRFVAEAKLRTDPSVAASRHDAALLTSKLRDERREAALIAVVRATAERYELNPDVVEHIFRWIIEETMRVEVAYLQG